MNGFIEQHFTESGGSLITVYDIDEMMIQLISHSSSFFNFKSHIFSFHRALISFNPAQCFGYNFSSVLFMNLLVHSFFYKKTFCPHWNSILGYFPRCPIVQPIKLCMWAWFYLVIAYLKTLLFSYSFKIKIK